jgi:adenylate cyclase class IV
MGLGDYLEVEYVLSEAQSECGAQAVVTELLKALEIQEYQLINGSYIDFV